MVRDNRPSAANIALRKIMFSVLSLVLITLAYATPCMAETATVKAGSARLRGGPGFYYDVTHIAPRGTVVEVLSKENGWLRIRLQDGASAYASERAFSSSAAVYVPGEAGVGGMANPSRPVMVAGVRGVADIGRFPAEYADRHELDPALLDRFLSQPFTPREFGSFSRKPMKNKDVALDGLAGPKGEPLPPLPPVDREIGAAIALRLLSVEKPSDDEALRKYVSLVGAQVVESTPAYDEEFVFIVLRSKSVNSFSTPGGFVFITLGALETMQSEAELAGVLAHEVAHVLMRHGLGELGRQRTRITAGGLMDELDAEVDKLGMEQGNREAEKGLSEMADDLFEKIVGGRKMQYEDDADILGTRILARTGYSATGLRDFVLRTEGRVTGEDARTYAYRHAVARAAAVDALIRSDKALGAKGGAYPERFRESVPRP